MIDLRIIERYLESIACSLEKLANPPVEVVEVDPVECVACRGTGNITKSSGLLHMCVFCVGTGMCTVID